MRAKNREGGVGDRLHFGFGQTPQKQVLQIQHLVVSASVW